MKDFVVTNYVFSPGTSGAGYVELYSMDDFDITRVVAIINQTKGIVIYATGSSATRYTSISGKKIYLYFDTSSHSSSDKLQIIYNSPLPQKTADTDQQELTKLLTRLVKVMENQQACDVAQRQKITLDAITASLTLATITTVSTVTSVSNAALIAGMGNEQYLNIARNTYSNAIRNKLSF